MTFNLSMYIFLIPGQDSPESSCRSFLRRASRLHPAGKGRDPACSCQGRHSSARAGSSSQTSYEKVRSSSSLSLQSFRPSFSLSWFPFDLQLIYTSLFALTVFAWMCCLQSYVVFPPIIYLELYLLQRFYV